MFYYQSVAATRRGYPISLTWFWPTQARVTASDQLSSAGFEPTAGLTFSLRVRRLNHSATRTLDKIIQQVPHEFCYKLVLPSFRAH